MDMNEQRKDALHDWASCIAPTTLDSPNLPKVSQQHRHHEFYKFPFALQPIEGNNGTGPGGAGNTLEMSREVPCIHLLALVHAASSAAQKTAVMHGEHQYDFPCHLPCDLNSAPETTFGQFAPITPEKASSNVDHRKNQQIEEQMNAGATSCEIFEQRNNKDVANPATDFSHATPSTQLQENSINKEGDNSIDLNQTPQLKQRRRKHRPKVIREGKPKPTPKPPTTKETPVRRKYVRKNALDKNATPPPPKELGECTDLTKPKSTKRSCRRVLNYDMKDPGDDISSLQKDTATLYPARKSSMEGREYVDCQKDTAEGKATVRAQIGHKNAVETELDGDTSSSLQRPNDSNCSSSMILTQENEQLNGSKRKYSSAVEQTEPRPQNFLGVHYNNMPAYENMMSYMHFPYIYKKRRTDKGCASIISSTSCHVTMAENVWRQSELQDVETILPSYRTQSSKRRRSKAPTRFRDLASLIRTPEHILLQSTCLTKPPADVNWQRAMNCNSTQTCMDALVPEVGDTLAKKKRTKRSTLTSSHRSLVLYKNQPLVSGSSGVPPEVACTQILSVDAIADQLKCLNINRESSKFAYQGYNVVYNTQDQENNALVLYRRDGTVVPIEGAFDPIKKRRPRPKVDLDEETDKVWKLLMDNINSEGADGTDEQKAKWWEEERRVFKGRADFFIARMHLVQGDRRFSPWKGSVVDSVVGVFLTQNVSDHLSSSAFMSLAAHFPLKSVNNQNASDEKVASLAVDEPEVCTSEISNQPLCDFSSVTFHDTEHSEEQVVNSSENTETTSEGVISTNEPDCKLTPSLVNGSATKNPRTASECYIEEDLRKRCDIVSSQNSVDSSTSQTVEKTGLCESNSETEDAPDTCQNGSLDHSTLFLQKAEVHSVRNSHLSPHDNLNCELHEPICMQHDDERIFIESGGASQDASNNCCIHNIPNPEVVQVECSELFEEVIHSSNISKNKYEDSPGEQSVLTAESVSQDTTSNKLTVNDQDAQRCFSESCTCIQEKSNMIQSQFRVGGNPNKVYVPAEKHTSKIQQSCNISEETTDIMHKEPESDLSFNEVSNVDAATSKTKNRRPGKDKKAQQDWDKLRERAEPNGRKREKTANTMDSVDWEAVRTANVNDIAQTIKERGMNNKLAERIKEFLNRLLREHGNVDLEWLRDVPPDQAKEYLLSFRGLGLKSVECVRLLTLHHLAFPVDTNVGRIAVRLGWVPLQPLPESLQLHLLELYPVLESIQKYLWPRLCKLDQRTLYELHYQMITFGKVFCTKSKPNCNACPMRGECRHFASAFASARLALPGPEEKSIVSATEDRNTYRNPGEINNKIPLPIPLPLPLPHPHPTEQLGGNQQLEASQQSRPKSAPGYTEPIIEEPVSPEPECTQIVEDIEDFYEDPDEIPTIKLNMEQFTQNLQNYMQQNMELQQGEMSKALVALTPDAASLPTPKLKNVSRLRTEHQVYELPDSHPLLDRLGLDKREPDDPCNYLLAIWTPGETANSIQPPENRCSSQEFGKLCDDKQCFQCNSAREAHSQTVRGTLLVPCRTAMRGSFPLNGTYFQVNEVFADHDSSLEPLDVPRGWLWNLNRRTVYFGTSIPTIFKGLTTPEIQHCFWRGFVCVRGFDQKSRGPRPLMARLHFPVSRLAKPKGKKEELPSQNFQKKYA
uniref:protein ROS1-like n=1 Tax=Fragaria vesca subsp. vesca TaxID=101020 RepID=UPI0005C96D64|nr:PREDICTED: protein ROS1-like [Fragaria vesca subsp. vesca]